MNEPDDPGARSSAGQGDQRARGVDEPGQGLAKVVRGANCGEIAFHVVDGALEHPEVIEEGLQLAAGDDEVTLVEPRVSGPLAALVVTLTTGAPAVDPGSSWSDAGGEVAAAPAAPPVGFVGRHSRRYGGEPAPGDDFDT